MNNTFDNLFDDLFCVDRNTTIDNNQYNKTLKIVFTDNNDISNTYIDLDNYIYGNEATMQDILICTGTNSQSNEFFPDMGNDFQKNTLNYALTSNIELQHQANFAALDVLNFTNAYINNINNILNGSYTTNLFDFLPETSEDSASTEYVKTVTDYKLIADRITYDNVNLLASANFSDGTTIGKINITI